MRKAKNSAEDAFQHLQNEHFDIVLVDYKMDGINGINVLQWMFGKRMDIPVILITSFGSEEIYEEALEDFNRYKNTKGLTYIYSDTFKGFVANPLPTFWSQSISKSFSGKKD